MNSLNAIHATHGSDCYIWWLDEKTLAVEPELPLRWHPESLVKSRYRLKMLRPGCRRDESLSWYWIHAWHPSETDRAWEIDLVNEHWEVCQATLHTVCPYDPEYWDWHKLHRRGEPRQKTSLIPLSPPQ